jgi:CheY-like chemotaxis protein
MTMTVMDAMPNVLLAVKGNSMLQVIRDMLRRCSVEEVESYTSLKDATAVLRAHARKWDIFAVDGRFPDSLQEIEAIREEMGPHVKILLLAALPMADEDIAQISMAGIGCFVGIPCSQADLEDKIDELMGREIPARRVSRKSILYHVN